LTGQWAARVRHLLLLVATAWTLFQSTPQSTESSLNVDRHVFVGKIVVFGKLTEIAWFQKYRLNVKLKVGWKLLRG